MRYFNCKGREIQQAKREYLTLPFLISILTKE